MTTPADQARLSELKAKLDGPYGMQAYNTHDMRWIFEFIERLQSPIPSQWMKLHSTALAIRMDVLNERQAQLNHGQSLKRLNERGGISPHEALAIIELRRLRFTREKEETEKFLKHVMNYAKQIEVGNE